MPFAPENPNAASFGEVDFHEKIRNMGFEVSEIKKQYSDTVVMLTKKIEGEGLANDPSLKSEIQHNLHLLQTLQDEFDNAMVNRNDLQDKAGGTADLQAKITGLRNFLEKQRKENLVN